MKSQSGEKLLSFKRGMDIIQWRDGFMKIGTIIVLMLLSFAFCGLAEDSTSGIVDFRSGEVYSCQVGQNIIIELPADDIYVFTTGKNQNWKVEKIENFIWVCPRQIDDMLNLTIFNSTKKGMRILIKSSKVVENPIRKILINIFPNEEIELTENANEQPKQEVPPIQKPISENENENEPKVKPVDLQTVFGLNGGFYSLSKNSYFQMSGDLIIAGKARGGLFFQGSAMAKMNGVFNQYGQSVGVGIEPSQFGIFLFADLIQTKFKDYSLSFHLQLRPSFRFRSDRIFATAFYAFPIIAEDYLGVDDPEDPDIGYFNKAISHLGFEVAGLIKNRFLLKINGIIGSSSIFKIGGGIDYYLRKNVVVKAYAHYQSYGDQPLLVGSDFQKAFEFNVGLTYDLTRKNVLKDLKNRLIYPVDYPIVVNVKQLKKNNDTKKNSPYIKLSADPIQGYAPLAVTFTQEFGGGVEPYVVELYPVYNYQPTLQSSNLKGYIYTMPGTYTAKAFIKDRNGNKAESNNVIIIVLQSDKTRWNIIVNAGTGGTVNPGSSQIEDGADSPIYYITADTGYVIDYVMIDGVNKGALTQYQFKNVKMNHNLEAFFRTGDAPPTNKYTIDASAGTGLSINPAGSRQYNAGSSADYTVSVIDANYEIYRVMVDGATVATNPANPYTYRFSNIQANHTINATSRLKTFTITATAGPNGTIAPSGAVVVNIGSSQGFTVTANSGYDIDVVTVDGGNVATSPASPYPYTFSNVQANHTINATFKQKLPVVFVDFHGPGHTDPGYGNYEKLFGSSMTINCIPNAGAEGDYIEVDGYRQTYQSSWTFSNIQGNHSFVAYFKSAPPPTYQVWENVRIVYTKDSRIEDLPPTSMPRTAGQWFTKTYYKILTGRPYTVLQWVEVDGNRVYPDGNGNVTVNFQVFKNTYILVRYNDTIN